MTPTLSPKTYYLKCLRQFFLRKRYFRLLRLRSCKKKFGIPKFLKTPHDFFLFALLQIKKKYAETYGYQESGKNKWEFRNFLTLRKNWHKSAFQNFDILPSPILHFRQKMNKTENKCTGNGKRGRNRKSYAKN